MTTTTTRPLAVGSIVQAPAGYHVQCPRPANCDGAETARVVRLACGGVYADLVTACGLVIIERAERLVRA